MQEREQERTSSAFRVRNHVIDTFFWSGKVENTICCK
jgi:hypothetical protein